MLRTVNVFSFLNIEYFSFSKEQTSKDSKNGRFTLDKKLYCGVQQSHRHAAPQTTEQKWTEKDS